MTTRPIFHDLPISYNQYNHYSIEELHRLQIRKELKDLARREDWWAVQNIFLSNDPQLSSVLEDVTQYYLDMEFYMGCKTVIFYRAHELTQTHLEQFLQMYQACNSFSRNFLTQLQQDPQSSVPDKNFPAIFNQLIYSPLKN